jgi:hypothetical protein
MGPRSCQRKESAPLSHDVCASCEYDWQSAPKRLKATVNSTHYISVYPVGYGLKSILRSNKNSHRQIPIPNEALLALIMLIDM